jgi:hypothetical protein
MPLHHTLIQLDPVKALTPFLFNKYFIYFPSVYSKVPQVI